VGVSRRRVHDHDVGKPRFYCGLCTGHLRIPCGQCFGGCRECGGRGSVVCPECRGGEIPPRPPDWL